jgi:hypothetical protein
MNKEYILLVVFLVATIIAGCFIFSIKDTRELKVFNNTEISFLYPAEYNISFSNTTNNSFIQGNANNKSFNISKSPVNTNFDDYKIDLKNNLSKENFVNDQMVNVNGVSAYQILYVPIAPLGNFFPRNTILILDKNNIRYTFTFSGEETLKDIPIIEKKLEIN